MPKACVHRMQTPLRSFEHYARGVLDIREDDVVLPVPKLFFGYARDLAALYPFGVGAAGIVFAERSTPERMFELIAEHRPTILVNVPTMIRAMLEQPDHDLSCLRLCTSAGEALPQELHRRWTESFGVEVLDGIGSSEAYHIYISNRPGAGRPGTLGQVVPGYSARVVDEDGSELPDDETGRLWVEGDTAALMYWDAREKSVQTYAGDVVMSGDLFARDADGFFHYRGRADDMLKVGGIWVAPQEIEQCLAAHADVAECAVVGYEEDGLQRPRAFVVARDGATADAAALQAHVKATLSPHKYPRDVRFVAELPRTGSGKIDRRARCAKVPAMSRRVVVTGGTRGIGAADRRALRRGGRRRRRGRPRAVRRHRRGRRRRAVRARRAGRRAGQQRGRGRQRAAGAHDARRLARPARGQRDGRVPVHARRAAGHGRSATAGGSSPSPRRPASPAPGTRRPTPPPSTPRSGSRARSPRRSPAPA